jgi:DNA-binding NarL/FixJ family response regulator
LPEVAQEQRTVAILADDLIWATRLSDAITAAGATPRRVRSLTDLAVLLASGAGTRLAVIDLTARAYDGVEAVRTAIGAGARVVAVGQHDDAALRRAALDAGAERVFTYRALFEDGPRTLAAWLAR